jgi:hypothetical protein
MRPALICAVMMACALALNGRAAFAQPCTGDCNGDGVVTVDELIRGIGIGIHTIELGRCAAMDANGDGSVTINELIQAVSNALVGCPAAISITAPSEGLLVLAGTVAAQITLPAGVESGSLAVHLDGADVTDQITISGQTAAGDLVGVGAGAHELTADARVNGATITATRHFEAVALQNPDTCEVLNDAECLLPYPSSRFLVADAQTATGYRLAIPAAGLPKLNGPPLSPDPLNRLDGFSPTDQILMHFPQGVDLERSNASRLLPPGCCGQPAGPPWIDTRTADARSLDPDSPTVLLDAETGDRVLHWLEPDAHANGDPARQALILRPGVSLVPGHHYIVAMRNLTAPDGTPVQAEAAFAALRDQRPTNIDAIESRRASFETIFSTLASFGIARNDLVLAFDFVVQSDPQLTAAMLSMRDQAFAWLDTVESNPDEKPFTIENVQTFDCTQPNAVVWREVAGTFQSPLYLTRDPNDSGVGFLNLGADGMPMQNGFTAASFTISIPCSALAADGPVPHPLVLGHGLFGRGSDMVKGIPRLAGTVVPWTYIAGATDWRGLSGLDAGWVVTDIIGVGQTHLNDFSALPDRLRQGMLNTLVLGRMMKRGLFNRDADDFRTPSDVPVFRGPDVEMFYYGISLGGIMGTFFSAVTPDVERFGIDVPAINFSCLLQRSDDFGQFQTLLANLGLTDPMQTLLGLQLLHEVWVAGEPAGYARHVTADPLPGSGGPKRIMMTSAWLDKQVSNQCSEIEARTLGLPNLVPASLQRALPGIPDRTGPLDSAYVMFDTGAFDLFDPADQPFIPPLANLIPSPVCDPHSDRPRIPDGIKMLANFLQPDGQVANFCNDLCDAGEPAEIAGGAATPCRPQ